jgi:16S rRNA (uracil1498-N3)-methyltransferase
LRVHRVHTQQVLEPGLEVVLEEAAAHYLGRVLRVSSGQAVSLFNGDGFEYRAEVLSAGRRDIRLAVTSRGPGLPESALAVTVVQALSRGERMDQTLQKCTELGAAGFQPLVSERSGLRLTGDKLARRIEHWQGVVISACEQSGRARVPKVQAPLAVSEWLARPAEGSRLVLDPQAPKALAGAKFGRCLELAVGPEGGFSPGELRSMREGGVQSVTLGPRILRTETAAPAAVAILQSVAGDLGRQAPD